MIFTIAARELRGLFLSPLAWVLLALAQIILAWVFLTLVEEFMKLQSQLLALENAPGVTDLVSAPLLRMTAWLLLLITPFLTMRLISGERRMHTLQLLLSSPLAIYEIVLGKYLGVVAFLSMLVMMVALMPLSLLIMGTDLDIGKLFGGVLGLLLLVSSFTAAGLFISSLYGQPTAAAVTTFAFLLLLWIIDVAQQSQEQVTQLLLYLSFLRHYDNLLRGMVNSVDIIYYLLFSTIFLGFAMRRLDNQRLLPQ